MQELIVDEDFVALYVAVPTDVLIGVGAFVGVVALFWLTKRLKDHPKVTPAYKIGGKKHG